MTDDITPSRAITEGFRWFPAVVIYGILAFLLILGLTVAGWQAGWWFTNQNATREAHMIRNGYSNQQTLREQITAQIANTDTLSTQIAASKDRNLTSALKAQRMAIAGIACQDAAGVTGDPLPGVDASHDALLACTPARLIRL